MKKLFLSMTLTLLMVGALAANAMGMTMRVDQTKNFDSTYNNREFAIGTISITEDKANELTNGDTFTLVVPDGAVWDRDNTKVYRYLDGKLDCELKENVDFKYDGDRKLKFTFKSVFGNIETYEIQGSVKLYGFIGNSISVSLWQTNLASFSPKEVLVADNKDVDQEKSITLNVVGDPVEVTVGDQKKMLASVKIAETTLSSFKPDDKIKLTILTEGVTFDNDRDEDTPYYYPIRWERLGGDKIFTTAVMENSKNASFKVERRSDSAASVRVDLRSISIAEDAKAGDIVVRVQAGTKTEELVVGKIVDKTAEQLEKDAEKEALAESQKPKIGRSIFKLNSLQYTFMDKEGIMLSAPYSRNGVTFIPASTLATVLGVTDSNYIWNLNEKKITMKSGKIVLEMILGSKNASLNGEQFTLNTAPEYSGASVVLPLREIAQIFGYTVNWVPSNRSIVVDPPVVLE